MPAVALDTYHDAVVKSIFQKMSCANSIKIILETFLKHISMLIVVQFHSSHSVNWTFDFDIMSFYY